MAHHMSSFVMSRAAQSLLSADETQVLADDTVAAAKYLMRMIILERRHPLQRALIDYMRAHHLEQFLQGASDC